MRISIHCLLALGSLHAFAAAPQYTITTFAGASHFRGDGGTASAAVLYRPYTVAVDSSGDVYIADGGNYRVRRVDAASGKISTVAGNGRNDDTGDNGPAVNASIGSVVALVLDSSGNLYIADGTRVRQVSPNGVITTVAGGGAPHFSSGVCTPSGDGSAATSASFCSISGMARDAQGNFYVADESSSAGGIIREFTVGGKVVTIAGTGDFSSTGDGGPAANASFGGIGGLAADTNGNLYAIDGFGESIRKIDANKNISTVFTPSGSQTVGAIAVDQSGALYFDDYVNIWKVANGAATIVATAGNGLSNTIELFGFAFDKTGNIFAADYNDDVVDRMSGGTVTTFAGVPAAEQTAAGLPATAPLRWALSGMAADSAGNVYVTDELTSHVLEKVTPAGAVTQLVTQSTTLPTGDSGTPTRKYVNGEVAVDPSGTIYFSNGHQVFKYSGGQVTLFAGRLSSVQQDDGDGGAATSAGIAGVISGLAADAKGDVFIAEFNIGGLVRKVDAQGIITTYAGGGTSGLGDNGPATAAQLSRPSGLAVDSQGDLFIADNGSVRVREVRAADQFIVTIAGNGHMGFSGDEGPATDATLSGPVGVAVDPSGNVFVSDTSNDYQGLVTIVPTQPNNRIRMVDTGGIIHTVAGSGTGGGEVGDGGPGTSAQLNEPQNLAADGAGNIYVLDYGNNKVRRLTPASLRIESAASFAYGPVAADSIDSAYGSDLATKTLPAQGTLTTELAGTTATIHDSAGADHAAPLFYVSSRQVNFEVPAGTAKGFGTVTVKSSSGTTATTPIEIVDLAPGIFMLNSDALVAANVVHVHADNSQTVDSVYEVQAGAIVARPVDLGPSTDKLFLLIYGTGLRAAGTKNVSVTVDGVPATVTFAGPQGTYVGEDQLNVQLPRTLAGRGRVFILVTANGVIANATTVDIK